MRRDSRESFSQTDLSSLRFTSPAHSPSYQSLSSLYIHLTPSAAAYISFTITTRVTGEPTEHHHPVHSTPISFCPDHLVNSLQPLRSTLREAYLTITIFFSHPYQRHLACFPFLAVPPYSTKPTLQGYIYNMWSSAWCQRLSFANFMVVVVVSLAGCIQAKSFLRGMTFFC